MRSAHVNLLKLFFYQLLGFHGQRIKENEAEESGHGRRARKESVNEAKT